MRNSRTFNKVITSIALALSVYFVHMVPAHGCGGELSVGGGFEFEKDDRPLLEDVKIIRDTEVVLNYFTPPNKEMYNEQLRIIGQALEDPKLRKKVGWIRFDNCGKADVFLTRDSTLWLTSPMQDKSSRLVSKEEIIAVLNGAGEYTEERANEERTQRKNARGGEKNKKENGKGTH